MVPREREGELGIHATVVTVGSSRQEAHWAREMVRAHHYLHKPPDRRSRPLCYVVHVASEPAGCLWFGRPESTRCFGGGLTYGSREDVAAGRAEFDRWEVLNLSRVWLDRRTQRGGEWCRPEWVPGFCDRGGVWRPALASWAIRQALGRVGFDYLDRHPPCFVGQPYTIRAVLSYCDTRLHRGTIYRAAGFRLARTNDDGIETWWTPAVTGLTAGQDLAIRERAASDNRSVWIRNRSRSLFDFTEGDR